MARKEENNGDKTKSSNLASSAKFSPMFTFPVNQTSSCCSTASKAHLGFAAVISIMESSCVQLLSTKKGNTCLVVDNYQLRRYREKEENITWVCIKEKKEKCKGRVKTTKQFEVLSKIPHTCVPNVAEIEIKKKMEKCRKRVRENVSVPVHKIFQEEMAEIYTRGYDFLAKIPSYENAKTTLCLERRKALGTTQNPPDSRAEQEIRKSSKEIINMARDAFVQKEEFDAVQKNYADVIEEKDRKINILISYFNQIRSLGEATALKLKTISKKYCNSSANDEIMNKFWENILPLSEEPSSGSEVVASNSVATAPFSFSTVSSVALSNTVTAASFSSSTVTTAPNCNTDKSDCYRSKRAKHEVTMLKEEASKETKNALVTRKEFDTMQKNLADAIQKKDRKFNILISYFNQMRAITQATALEFKTIQKNYNNSSANDEFREYILPELEDPSSGSEVADLAV